jgi:hypothetical protein
MANTSILIKRSTTVGTPVSLQAGELAYSYLSNTIFIGSPDGNGVVNVGGQYYTSQIDSATSSNNVSTIVKRDAAGNVAVGHITARSLNVGGATIGGAGFTGNANSATQFATDRFIDISGGDITASAQLFNGTANATLSASLSTVSGLTAGTYGGSTTVPIVTVAANGRIMSIANSSTISTALNIAGDSGTDSVSLSSDTLTFVGGDGVTSAVTDNAVSFAVDTTVIRGNTAISSQTIDGDLEISGNLTVLGTETIINVTTLEVSDPLLYLAGNNYTSDAVDIGFVGHYNNGSANLHAGLIRHAGNKEFYVFDSYNVEPDSNVIDISGNGFNVANLHANLISAWSNVTSLHVGSLDVAGATTIKSLSLTDDLSVSNGGTGAGSFTAGAILVGDGTNSLKTLANSTYTATGTGAANNTVSSITVDPYGRVTAATFEQITGLTVGQGGTGASSFTAGQVVIGNGSGALLQLANVTALSATVSSSNTVGSLTTDVYGRVTGFTEQAISGLTVAQGGTGASSLTAGQMLVGNGTGAIQAIANVTYSLTGTLGAAKTITSLTVDAYGRVSAATASDISGLTVAQGGTGASTFTAKGIVYGDGTNALSVTAAAGTSDQTWSNQILTTTNAGVPVWTSTLDGGQF